VKPAELRPLAETDLVERTRHYRGAGGSELGTRFFDVAIAALRSIEEAPGIGSPKIGELIGVRVGMKELAEDSSSAAIGARMCPCRRSSQPRC